MRFILQKCQKTFYCAIFFAGIASMGIPTANALEIGDFNFGLLCGPIHMTPIPVPVGTGFGYITASTTVTVLKAGTADRKILRHFVVVKLVNPNGTVAWTRSLQTQSLAIAEVDLDATPPSYFLPDTVDASERSASPALFLPVECLSVGVAASGNKSYVTVALGTSSSTGSSPVTTENEPKNPTLMASGKTLATIKGQDKTVLNISILNINNGNVIRTFRPRPKPNRFFLIASSGIFDIDNDFNDELILSYIKFVGDTRHDTIFEHYNIVTGALKRTTTTTQFNRTIFQK